ncbi:hypothetical protein THAOC_33554 [Thalassiosira oceanica]|uniref:Uncharacterized protein n=1 Tax=Thalassiosira oceanica TaxID=159749 RepID=K0R500_THAOC|nr:hypothetical protein THAOC_33554 [Thalassiosira oceanica]|eukprot:EJK47710.1 hypothetical protein THAOC_33554 [Thalassiosira oceanica]
MSGEFLSSSASRPLEGADGGSARRDVALARPRSVRGSRHLEGKSRQGGSVLPPFRTRLPSSAASRRDPPPGRAGASVTRSACPSYHRPRGSSVARPGAALDLACPAVNSKRHGWFAGLLGMACAADRRSVQPRGGRTIGFAAASVVSASALLLRAAAAPQASSPHPDSPPRRAGSRRLMPASLRPSRHHNEWAYAAPSEAPDPPITCLLPQRSTVKAKTASHPATKATPSPTQPHPQEKAKGEERENVEGHQVDQVVPKWPKQPRRLAAAREPRQTAAGADEGDQRKKQVSWSQSTTPMNQSQKPANQSQPARTTSRLDLCLRTAGQRQQAGATATGQPKPRDIHSGCSTRGTRGGKDIGVRSASSTLDCPLANIQR